MEQRVSVITLPVTDIARSKAFYCAGLSWEAAFANEEAVFFQLNGLVLSLFRQQGFVEDSTRPWQPGHSSFALAHNTRSQAEVDTVFAQALAAGATAVKPPQATFWGGYAGYFADPDGHLWEVAHNPAWPITAEGETLFAPQ